MSKDKTTAKATVKPATAKTAVEEMVKKTKGPAKKEWKRLDTLLEEKQAAKAADVRT